MITAFQIEEATGLTGVTLYGDGTITADQPITDAIKAKVTRWHAAGRIDTEAELWADFLAGSITVGGIALKASIEARDAFTGQSTLIREGLELNQLTPTTQTSIWDAANTEHHMTVTECRTVLFQYGVAWKAAFDELAP